MLEEAATSLPPLSDTALSSTSHRPYLPYHLACGFMSEFRVDYSPDSEAAQRYVEDRVKQVEVTKVFYNSVYKSARDIFAKLEKTADLDLFPEYIQALRNCGHKANLVLCGEAEMRTRLARLINREYQKMRKKDKTLPDAHYAASQVKLPSNDAHNGLDVKYVVGWDFSPQNFAPVHLVPGTNQPNRSRVFTGKPLQ